MSAENINKLILYAEKENFKYFDIGEQKYNGKEETVLVVYANEEHTQEKETYVLLD